MRCARLLMAAVLALTPTAHAAPVWTAPGWYQIADTIVGPFVWEGPFASKEACEATLPKNEEDANFSCEWLETRPDWDD